MKHRKLNLRSETVRTLSSLDLRAARGGDQEISGHFCSFVYSCNEDCTSGFPPTTGEPSMPQVCPMRAND